MQFSNNYLIIHRRVFTWTAKENEFLLAIMKHHWWQWILNLKLEHTGFPSSLMQCAVFNVYIYRGIMSLHQPSEGLGKKNTSIFFCRCFYLLMRLSALMLLFKKIKYGFHFYSPTVPQQIVCNTNTELFKRTFKKQQNCLFNYPIFIFMSKANMPPNAV